MLWLRRLNYFMWQRYYTMTSSMKLIPEEDKKRLVLDLGIVWRFMQATTY